MTLTELLKSELVLTKNACASIEELIAKLVDKIYETGQGFPLSRENLLATIYKREKIGGTLLPSGLSVPHARLENFEGFTIALGTPARPLFLGKQEIRFCALMITSQSGGSWYLPALAALTKLSKDEGYFSRLCGAEDPGDLINILKEHDPPLE